VNPKKKILTSALVIMLGLGLFQISTGALASPSLTNNATDFNALINQLKVENEITIKYDRKLFKHWVDADKNGCDTRREVLIQEAVKKPRVGKGCTISGGQWLSKYDNQRFTNPASLDIDHLVPLKEAWESGAANWDSKTRETFANDLGYSESLIAVSAKSNRSKSDKDPADWMPTSSSYRCTYVYTWVQVKLRWDLSADNREVASLKKHGQGCEISKIKVKPSTRAKIVVAIGVTPPNTPSVSLQPPTETSKPSLPTITAGAYCKASDKGLKGVSKTGVTYTCKASETDSRLRWRR
jgi:hypothetical protein